MVTIDRQLVKPTEIKHKCLLRFLELIVISQRKRKIYFKVIGMASDQRDNAIPFLHARIKILFANVFQDF